MENQKTIIFDNDYKVIAELEKDECGYTLYINGNDDEEDQICFQYKKDAVKWFLNQTKRKRKDITFYNVK